MIQIQQNFNLKTYNTFGFDVTCSHFLACQTADEVQEALVYLKEKGPNYLILGGGSNVLFRNNFDGLVIHPVMDSIQVVREDEEHVWLEAEAGVEWDRFVEFCIDNQWYGLENLSYIPGNVGASPVQNIGAYGVEVKDCIESVKGYFIDDIVPFELDNKACRFAYRQSIFKADLKHKTIITSVVFKLNKKASYNLNYGPVKEEVQKRGAITLQNLRSAIIDIRKSKLPEPDEYGNAGSFFKNPVIANEQFTLLQKQYPTIPGYPMEPSLVKVPAGWLIEQAGWKGKSFGPAAVHNKQALVLINIGGASGDDVMQLAEKIIGEVADKFGITIEPEVNIV
ncbi:UDP-N-acetylmuramate dehydrogenase [Carboxylicivirga taeanensis]|uniref:UDP-N-acetylmuramate dehydrogenase n=1 Tax=Carboxylicivirga taeanensis TaxID=1416875 RepID=UPI003F6DF636